MNSFSRIRVRTVSQEEYMRKRGSLIVLPGGVGGKVHHFNSMGNAILNSCTGSALGTKSLRKSQSDTLRLHVIRVNGECRGAVRLKVRLEPGHG